MTGLIESTLYLSVTAIVILLFKRIFKNKLSAKWHVLVWALLALRLVLPSLPESSFSIFNVVDIPENKVEIKNEIHADVELPKAQTERLIYGEPQNITPQPLENTAFSETEKVTLIKPTIEPVVIQEQTPIVISDNRQPKAKIKINIDDTVKFIYRVGAVILFVYFVCVYAVCVTRVRKNGKPADSQTASLLEECKKKTGVSRRVFAVEYGNNPMLMGLVKPTVVLPDGYTEDEKRDIIIHELCHLKGGDIYLIWLSMIVLCLNWFNPVMWLCFFVFRRDIEVYCDERVLKYVDSKKNYASLLVKTALKKNSFIAGTTSLKNSEKEVERRVKYMAYFKKPNVWWTLLLIVIAVVIGVVCLTNPVDNEQKENTAQIYRDFFDGTETVEIRSKSYNFVELVDSVGTVNQSVYYYFHDMNGDGVDELHLKTSMAYFIYTIKDEKMSLWYQGTIYENPTQDGNIVYIRHGGAPTNQTVIYISLDENGNEEFRDTVAKYDEDEDGTFETFFRDNKKISELEYSEISGKYLSRNIIYLSRWTEIKPRQVLDLWKKITGDYYYESTSFDYVNQDEDNNIVIRYPVFIGMDEVTEAIKDAAFEPYLQFKHDVPDFNMTTWEIDYEIEYMSDNYISVVFDGYMYTKGTAHGTNYRYAVTVDVANKKPVELNDVFNSRFTECITHENFRESVDIDLSGEPDGMDLLFNNIRQEFETERYNEYYDYFHFTNDKFHIIHYPQSSGFCFTADYESLKPYMKDHPIWHELGFEPNDYDYSEVYDKNVKVMESSKNFLLEDRTDKYYFEVNANNGENLDSGFVDKCPVFRHLDGPLYELRTSYGTFEWESIFFDVERGTVSVLFDRPFYLTNTVIACVNSNDYYDESLTNKTGVHTNIVFFDFYNLELVGSVDAEFLKESTSYLIDYIDDTHISVTYYTENGQKENKKILEVPSLTGVVPKEEPKPEQLISTTTEKTENPPVTTSQEPQKTQEDPKELPTEHVAPPLPSSPEELSLGMDETFFGDIENTNEDELDVAAETLW